MNKISVTTLYEQDFSLWIEDTVSKLKVRDDENLDWENLIEEVEFLVRKIVGWVKRSETQQMLENVGFCLQQAVRVSSSNATSLNGGKIRTFCGSPTY
jgi:hypothetical protein